MSRSSFCPYLALYQAQLNLVYKFYDVKYFQGDNKDEKNTKLSPLV